ncbi:MAG: hypothetical protein R3E77_15235 [Steroidobacteraceae bacterium]
MNPARDFHIKTLLLIAGLSLASQTPGHCQEVVQTADFPPVAAPGELTSSGPIIPDSPPRPSFKRLFAQTLGNVVQAGGAVLLNGLTQTITGGLTEWFSRKLKVAPQASVAAQEPLPVPDANGFAQSTGQPLVSSASQPRFFDPATGAPLTGDSQFSQNLEAGATGGEMFAGLAFEVHLLFPDGSTQPVDPAGHEFRSGDRFIVFLRPTLPGQMDVFNINPAGQQTQIDHIDLAGAQLAQLGPYEFTALTGNEQLRLVLTPCATPQLLAATRDIVNVAAIDAAGSGLGSCAQANRFAAAATTRDIRKVAVEGATAFALDAVAPAELDSGAVAPREITIFFRHL